jgi:hypothetical protein
VIPFRLGGYRNPGSFALLGFRDAPPVVYVEHEGASGFLDAPKDASMFQEHAVRLTEFALGSADSVNFLTKMASDYEWS